MVSAVLCGWPYVRIGFGCRFRPPWQTWMNIEKSANKIVRIDERGWQPVCSHFTVCKRVVKWRLLSSAVASLSTLVGHFPLFHHFFREMWCHMSRHVKWPLFHNQSPSISRQGDRMGGRHSTHLKVGWRVTRSPSLAACDHRWRKQRAGQNTKFRLF